MKNIKEKVLKDIKGNYTTEQLADDWDTDSILIEGTIDKTLAEVGKVINEEKKFVRFACLGLVHPPQDNQEDFTKWLQGTVNFHLTLLKQKIGIK